MPGDFRELDYFPDWQQTEEGVWRYKVAYGTYLIEQLGDGHKWSIETGGMTLNFSKSSEIGSILKEIRIYHQGVLRGISIECSRKESAGG